MLPVLKSCLDDSDAKTRQLVCLALQYLFHALPHALGRTFDILYIYIYMIHPGLVHHTNFIFIYIYNRSIDTSSRYIHSYIHTYIEPWIDRFIYIYIYIYI